MTTTATTLPDTLKLIATAATRDAAVFFAEFGEPIDPDQTDWDATAWAASAEEFVLDRRDAALYAAYQAALVLETTRLAYTLRFSDLGEAMAFETHILNREVLPKCAQAVLDDRTAATAEYYTWLTDQHVEWQHVLG